MEFFRTPTRARCVTELRDVPRALHLSIKVRTFCLRALCRAMTSAAAGEPASIIIADAGSGDALGVKIPWWYVFPLAGRAAELPYARARSSW